jgi:hypothetical protein
VSARRGHPQLALEVALARPRRELAYRIRILEHHARRVDGVCVLEEAVSGKLDRAARAFVPSIAASQSWVKVTENSPSRRIPHPIRALLWNLPACTASYSRLEHATRRAASPDNWSENPTTGMRRLDRSVRIGQLE